jgi:tetratricopeptide (TPR) repeat protein
MHMIIAENLYKFLDGRATWAEVEGMTSEQATRYMQMGFDRLRTGQFEEAQRVFECLATINPRDADTHALVGASLEARGELAGAVKAFGRAIAINPRHVVALANRGELRRKLGDELGINDLQRAAELDPMGQSAAGKRAGQLVRALAFRGYNVKRAGKAAPPR